MARRLPTRCRCPPRSTPPASTEGAPRASPRRLTPSVRLRACRAPSTDRTSRTSRRRTSPSRRRSAGRTSSGSTSTTKPRTARWPSCSGPLQVPPPGRRGGGAVRSAAAHRRVRRLRLPGGPRGRPRRQGNSEVHCFWTDRYVVTVHRGDCAAIESVHAHGQHHATEAASPQIAIVYFVIERAGRQLLPGPAAFDDKIDALEDDDPQGADRGAAGCALRHEAPRSSTCAR